jgi:predicted TPR repeat methyltransferase
MPRPRLKIEVRVAKCFFKHFVSRAAAAAGAGSRRRNSGFSSDAAAAAGVARQALTSSYNWSSSCFSIPQLQEQISSRQLTHQAITETTTMDNIARAQAYVRQAPRGFKQLPGAPQSERKIVVHFHDTLSSNDTSMVITICYPANDPKMMIQVLSRS